MCTRLFFFFSFFFSAHTQEPGNKAKIQDISILLSVVPQIGLPTYNTFLMDKMILHYITLNMVQEHVDAAALNHVAGRVVCGVAVEGDPGQRRTQQVRHAGNYNLIFNPFFKVTLLLSFAATEICRLRWNWFYLILLGCLDVINYSSPLPSFHQFITNPTAQQLNGAGREHEVYCYCVVNSLQLSTMSSGDEKLVTYVPSTYSVVRYLIQSRPRIHF